MLAVVDLIAGNIVDEGVRSSPATGFLLYKEKRAIVGDEVDRGGESGDAAADDENVGFTYSLGRHETGALDSSTTPRP